MTPKYVYRFEANGQIRCLSKEAGRLTVTTSLDGVQTTTSLGPFASAERDLLRVTAAALEADRLSPRRPPTTRSRAPRSMAASSRIQRSLHWQRRLELQVCVESPERWSEVAPQLAELLSFMTDDSWDLRFEPCQRLEHGQQQLLPLKHPKSIREVALFSGGLDSVVGMFAQGRDAKGSLLAVSSCGNDVQETAQTHAFKTLGRFGVQADWLKLKHRLCHRRTRSEMEASQRSRGLLFLAMGAVAASHSRLRAFSVYETGTGCINLPTSAAQVGAQGTRAMHPRTLSLFNQLTRRVLDQPVQVLAPFFLLTKGDLCRLAGKSLGALAKVSMSCDEGEGHKPDPMLHCGLCTSCLFRRIALHAAGLVPDTTHYRDAKTRRHGAYEIAAFEHHAAVLASCRSFDDLVELDPDVRFATSLPVVEPPDETGAARAVVTMYQRYAAEIEAYFSAARPTVAASPRQPRRERERDLFSAVR